MDKIEKVYNYIREHRMLEQNSSVIVGVSGGADSVCLYKILLELRNRLGLKLYVVHIHHGIRGEEAERDMEFVRQMCECDGVICHIYRYQVPEYAKEHGLSEEEAGRLLRYEAFEKEADMLPGEVAIAVAHNRNDVAETFIHNLCRGSGLKGLTGMDCVKGRIIRPILCMDRAEIEDYLEGKGYGYVNDSTNMSEEYTRNRIRHIILPYFAEHINQRSVEHILNAADELRAADEYIGKITDYMYEKMVMTHNNCIYINKMAFYGTDEYIRRRVVRKAVEQAAGNLKDITRVHIEDIMGLFSKQTGKYVMLPYGLKAYSDYDKIILSRESEKKAEVFATNVGGTGTYIYGEYAFKIEVFEVENCKSFIKNLEKTLKSGEKLYTKWFDYDKINSNVQIRNRRSEDYLVINQKGNRKKLKNYLVDEKIPQNERDSIPLFADGSHIMWVVGHRISEAYKVSSDTKRVLKITGKDKQDGGQD